MSEFQAKYRSVKPDLESLALPLMDFAEEQVRRHGAFLPVGARLTTAREVVLVAAAPGDDVTTSEVVLPLLVEALAAETSDGSSVAAAAVEWVNITVADGNATDAIKVLVHHSTGIAVAFYVPAIKRVTDEWIFGDTLVRPAAQLVPQWPVLAAS